jgi:glycosyltransferase involved in cell wall biosynthesis
MLLPVSVYIVAHNEADRIGKAVGSVRGWVDEMVVVDSGSSDGTVALCESLGARVLHNPWPGYGMQKRFAEDQCKHRWLLNLDADEEITPELANEIQALFADGEPAEAGFVLKIRDLLPGEKRLAATAHTDFRIRLYNRNKARIEASVVHDPVIVEQGQTRMLANPALHRSYRNLSHAIEKMNAYTNMQANYLHERGVALATLRLVTEFPLSFIKAYILRGYVTRGKRGLIYSIHYAYARFVRLAKYVEKRDD